MPALDALLAPDRLLDLTQPLGPATPLWPGSRPLETEIDTLGVDPGHVVEPLVHRITLPAGLWHLEGLVNLDRVPARGAWLVAGVLPLVDGSGAPARVFAVLPA